ncbi:MAG: DnaJ domain-containing protein [Sulfuricaulis sp.]
MNDPFLQHYRTLGIEPGCTPDQLKNAYRRLVKAWHPDHYSHQHEAGSRANAERRMREINRAFRTLSDYRKRHGCLPAAEPAAGRVEEPFEPPFQSSNGNSQVDNEINWGKPAPSGTHRRPLYFILLGVALGVIWAAWSAHQRGEPTGEMTSSPEASEPTADASNTAPMNTAMPVAPQKNSYFTVGSPLGKVYAVQGVPTRTQDGVWYYGKSMVFFEDGVVSRWEEDQDNPLKTKPVTETALSTLKTFGIGSTKAEVKAIQGNPFNENSTRWDYGLSQVFFRDGKVIRWYESPLAPLKTHN